MPSAQAGERKPLVCDPDFILWRGDSFEIVGEMASESVDAIVTSPPYGDARDDDYPCAKPDDYADWIEPLLEQLYRVLKPAGGFMLNLGRIFRGGVEHPYIDETLARARDLGWLRIDTLIWQKPNARGNQHERLRDQHEYVFWLAKHPNAYRGFDTDTRSPYAPSSLDRYERPYKSAAKGRPRAEAGRTPHPDGTKPGSVFACTVGHEKGVLHPAPMAIKLARHLVSLSCPPGGLVLDPFLGSGTTAVACRQRGRLCFGIEALEEHAEEARGRLSQLSLLAEDVA